MLKRDIAAALITLALLVQGVVWQQASLAADLLPPGLALALQASCLDRGDDVPAVPDGSMACHGLSLCRRDVLDA